MVQKNDISLGQDSAEEQYWPGSGWCRRTISAWVGMVPGHHIGELNVYGACTQWAGHVGIL